MKIKILILCFAYLSSITVACKNHKTCKQCITDPSLCVWCTSTDPEYDKEPRCRSRGSFPSSWCSGLLDKPGNASINFIKNENFSSNTEDVVIQIKPQIYAVKLRPGVPLNFSFSFQKAKDYPVDLYILIDASQSMKSIKKQLVQSSQIIYETMQSMTKKVHMGFGTFIDKNTMPYTISSKANNAYSFRNRLNLTSDFTKFEKIVNGTKFGKNYDPPEGGFDALAQVLACNVNWRDDSRKIVLFLANSNQHGVGDGRIAGIFQPYDRKCHTDTNGIYTKELDLDYPSLTDINVLASIKKVTIIFAVEKATNFFQSLPGYIAGSRVVDLEGTVIVTMLEQIYKEISTNIKFEVEVKSGHGKNYEIKFHPDCNSADVQCKVETGETRDFEGTVTLKEYYGQDTDDIYISVQGIKERLELKVDVIQCSCEADQGPSDHCHGQKLQCGTCICDETTHGNRCMCTKGVNKVDDSLCIAPPTTTEPGIPRSDVLCSGEGECECGLCKCNKGRIGTFCQCNLRSCPGYSSGMVCGGHGECSCTGDSENKAVCTCHRGWSLKPGAEYLGCVCDDLATSMCIDSTNTICNNRGNCTCNSCDCQPIPDWDKRIEQDSLCNIKPCPSCHSMQCSAVRNCVHCRLNSEHCYSECTGIFLKDKIYDVMPNLSSEWKLCEHEKLDSGCYTKFAYQYDDRMGRILLVMQKDADCAENYYKFGGIILGTVLLVGILTLLVWKCLTRYQDIKEYKKFEAENKEILNAPCTNPLYDEPRTFRNPAFKKSFS